MKLVGLVVYLVLVLPSCDSVHNRISHRLKVNPNTPSPIQMHYIPHTPQQGRLKAIMEMLQCTYYPSQIEEIQETPLNRLNGTDQIVNNTQIKRCFMSSQNYIDPSLNQPQQLQSLLGCNKQRRRLSHGQNSQYNLECNYYNQKNKPKYRIVFNQNSYKIDRKEKEILETVQPSVKEWVRFIVRFYQYDDDDDESGFTCNDLKYVRHYRCQWKKRLIHNNTDNSTNPDFSRLISQYIKSHSNVNHTNHTVDIHNTINVQNDSKFTNLRTEIDNLQKEKPIRDYRYQVKVKSIIENIKGLIIEKQKKLNMMKYFQEQEIEREQKVQIQNRKWKQKQSNMNTNNSLDKQHQSDEKNQNINQNVELNFELDDIK